MSCHVISSLRLSARLYEHFLCLRIVIVVYGGTRMHLIAAAVVAAPTTVMHSVPKPVSVDIRWGRKEGLLYTVSLCLVWTITCKQCHVESSLCNELRTVIWFAVEGASPDDTVLYQQMLIMVLTILYARCACKRIDWGLCSCTRTLTHLPVPVHRRTFLFVFTRSRSRGGQCH